jgi:hypothetical protein
MCYLLILSENNNTNFRGGCKKIERLVKRWISWEEGVEITKGSRTNLKEAHHVANFFHAVWVVGVRQ